MQLQHLDPHEWLEREYLKRKRKNSSYSLRRFSQQLGINSGRLSQYLTQKRRITPQAALALAEKLRFVPADREAFIQSVNREYFKSGIFEGANVERKQLDVEEFELISNPIHYSLLCLFETEDFRSDVSWMGERLKCDVIEIRNALSRLKRLGMIEEGNGDYNLSLAQPLTTTHDQINLALQRAHKQNLAKIIDEIEDIDVSQRDVTSVTIAVNSKQLEGAKEMIRKFRNEISKYLEHGEQDEVYQINIQLFPQTELKTKEQVK